MKIIAMGTVGLVSLLHFYFLVLEMFLWTHPIGQRVFDITEEYSAATSVLAANQGLYNGFLAVGLLWALITKKHDVVLFFLLCVITAGIFGAVTANPRIFFVQALPAIIALLLTFFFIRKTG